MPANYAFHLSAALFLTLAHVAGVRAESPGAHGRPDFGPWTLREADLLLNNVYQCLMTVVDDPTRRQLQLDQREWIKVRNEAVEKPHGQHPRRALIGSVDFRAH